MDKNFLRDNDLGLLLLRLTVGGLMLFHGVHKLIYGVSGIEGMLAGMGLPGFIAYFSLAADDFRDDLVGFDDFEFCALVANAQSFTFADVAQRGTFHRGAFKLYGSKDGHGRNCRCGATPFDVVEYGHRALVGPFKGIARTCGMVPGDRSCLCVVVVIVGDDESVDGVGHRLHLLGPSVDGILDMFQRWLLNQFVLHRTEAQALEPDLQQPKVLK